MIRALLQNCHLQLRKSNGVLSQAVTNCAELIGEDGVRLLQQVIDKWASDLQAASDAKLADKLRNITHSSQEEKEVLVHKISSKQFSPAQFKVLSHEACFNITEANPVNRVATVESIVKQIGNPTTTLYLAANNLIVDKGCSTVLLNNTDYIQKANAYLEDRQAYLPCDDETMKKQTVQAKPKASDRTAKDMASVAIH
ncbi:unnamed protein product [Schistocephalus solidus]|uniref:tRNA_edit domain-containing protein n=1 Tax=Schistocephalus solidus TaxID=70667 RepID=A0A183TPX0_SCHSO|nr:unnamed protein product [Schistocephalus solidus]